MIIFLYEVSGQNRQATVKGKAFDRSDICKAHFTDYSSFGYMTNTPPEWVEVVNEGEEGYRADLATTPHKDLPEDTTVIIITGTLGENAEVRTTGGVSHVNNGGKLRSAGGQGTLFGDGLSQTIIWPKD